MFVTGTEARPTFTLFENNAGEIIDVAMISILIPAFNEAERIGNTIAALRGIDVGHDSEIIVIDDGSADGTAAIAETAGADIVLRQSNTGKGAALSAGLRLVHGDVLLLIDADLGDSAREAVKLLEPVLAGTADMTIATFPDVPGKGGGLGFVVRLARWGIRRLTGRELRAPLSGQRALRASVLDATGGVAAGWGVEIALTVRALWAGLRVEEVATEMDHRVTGRSIRGFVHRGRQFWAALLVLIQLWRESLRRCDGGN